MAFGSIVPTRPQIRVFGRAADGPALLVDMFSGAGGLQSAIFLWAVVSDRPSVRRGVNYIRLAAPTAYRTSLVRRHGDGPRWKTGAAG